MEERIKDIVLALLKGEDYRRHVVAAIQSEFVLQFLRLAEKVAATKSSSQGEDWWEDELIRESTNSKEVVWFGGTNLKTVINQVGSSKRESCIEVSVQNVQALDLLIEEALRRDTPKITISIETEGSSVTLDEKESARFFSAIAAMKGSLRGGAWSKVGNMIEDPLLKAIFKLLGLPDDAYEINPTGADVRQIDAIIFHQYNPIKLELKLLGVGNPELADQALARPIQLFLVDQISPMMRQQFEKKGIKVIQFHNNYALEDLHNFFKSRGIHVKRHPSLTKLEQALNKIHADVFAV